MGGDIRSYTVHGLKSTFLSWGQQLNLPEKQRRLQGKHKAQQSSTRLYSRDDVHGALQFQTSIVEAVRSGFRPTTPLGRGGQHPMEEPKFQLQFFPRVPQTMCGNISILRPNLRCPPIPSICLRMRSHLNRALNRATPPTLTQVEMADEIRGALHRNMWHVAMTAVDFDDTVVTTACGRKFPRCKLAAVSDLELAPGQNLCSHPGCRKGWQSVGAL